MAGEENFDRQYRLMAGPGGSGFEIGETSKSQPVPLHIDFEFQKTDLTSQNTGRVSVWNLNPSQLAALNEKDCALALKAGYGSRLSLIFSGIVSHVTTELDGADRKTEIEVIDNLVEIRDTYVTVSYSGKVNWKTIITDTANQMGVAVTFSYNADMKATILSLTLNAIIGHNLKEYAQIIVKKLNTKNSWRIFGAQPPLFRQLCAKF